MRNVVTAHKNKLIFPPCIPIERNKKLVYITCIFASGLIQAISCFFTDQKLLFLFLPLGVLLASYIAELIYRICLLIEEYNHFEARYDKDIIKLIVNTFEFSKLAMTILLCCVCYQCYVIYNEKVPLNFYLYFLSSVVAFLWNKIINIQESTLNDSLLLNELHKKQLDFGSSLALMYFYGYLNIILPYKGEHQLGIRNILKEYESKQGIKFETYKLIILLPLSCNCKSSLKDISENIDEAKSLEATIIDRGAVKNREYKNSVYKFKKNGKILYAAVEYATPFLTYYETLQYNNISTTFYSIHRKEITLQFYLTLRNLLRKHSFHDVCELIYYNDIDEEGNYYDVADIVLERLEFINQQKIKKE